MALISSVRVALVVAWRLLRLGSKSFPVLGFFSVLSWINPFVGILPSWAVNWYPGLPQTLRNGGDFAVWLWTGVEKNSTAPQIPMDPAQVFVNRVFICTLPVLILVGLVLFCHVVGYLIGFFAVVKSNCKAAISESRQQVQYIYESATTTNPLVFAVPQCQLEVLIKRTEYSMPEIRGHAIRLSNTLVVPTHVLHGEFDKVIVRKTGDLEIPVKDFENVANDVSALTLDLSQWSKLGASKSKVSYSPKGSCTVAVRSAHCTGDYFPGKQAYQVFTNMSTMGGFSGAAYVSFGEVVAMHQGNFGQDLNGGVYLSFLEPIIVAKEAAQGKNESSEDYVEDQYNDVTYTTKYGRLKRKGNKWEIEDLARENAKYNKGLEEFSENYADKAAEIAYNKLIKTFNARGWDLPEKEQWKERSKAMKRKEAGLKYADYLAGRPISYEAYADYPPELQVPTCASCAARLVVPMQPPVGTVSVQPPATSVAPAQVVAPCPPVSQAVRQLALPQEASPVAGEEEEYSFSDESLVLISMVEELRKTVEGLKKDVIALNLDGSHDAGAVENQSSSSSAIIEESSPPNGPKRLTKKSLKRLRNLNRMRSLNIPIPPATQGRNLLPSINTSQSLCPAPVLPTTPDHHLVQGPSTMR